MDCIESIITYKDQQSKKYLFDESTSLMVEYGEFGYKVYSFRSSQANFYADNVKFNPCEIYIKRDRKEYVMSIYFEKSFPLIHKDYQTRITWTAFNCVQSHFNTVTETICLKEGEKICYIKRENSPNSKEKLYYNGSIEANELEFFVCLLYTLHYPEQTASYEEYCLT